MSAFQDDHLPILEPCIVEDTFVTEMAFIERVGPMARLTFAVKSSAFNGRVAVAERHVRVRLVLPADALPAIAQALLGRLQEVAKVDECFAAQSLNS
jgi:hypothetical protein